MSARRAAASRTPLAALAGFVAGVGLTTALMWNGAAGGPPADLRGEGEDCGQAVLDNVEAAAPRRGMDDRRLEPAEAEPPRIGSDPVPELRERRLLMPVEGFNRGDLRSSFAEPRGANRLHEALDVLAPRNTPVVAVEDGTIARLFSSKAGGITLYQFDPTTTYVYYYAHLERYAVGLREGGSVRRGQVVGYVGTSGNAPKDTPHLHFAIFRLTEKKQWWEGAPIDPYEVLR